MKKIKILLAFLVLLSSCSKDDGKISFTLLQLNDVYEISSIQGGKFGGMARVETLHKELSAKNKNTLLVMAGDFLNPSLIGTMKHNGVRVSGKQMVEVMNAMNFDLAAFGNHEFDLSQKDLQKRLMRAIFLGFHQTYLIELKTLSYPLIKTLMDKKHLLKVRLLKKLLITMVLNLKLVLSVFVFLPILKIMFFIKICLVLFKKHMNQLKIK